MNSTNEMMSRRKTFGWIAVALVLAALAGCAPVNTEPSQYLVWPRPPDTPRIQFVSAFSSPRQLGIKSRWLKKLGRVITGEKKDEARMISPYGVFVGANGDVLVTDTAAPAVHLFERSKNRYAAFAASRDLPLQTPIGAAFVGDNQIWITDSAAGRVWVVDRKGRTLAAPDAGHFLRPTGIAVDETARLVVVVDTLAHNLKCFSYSGQLVKTIGSRGMGPCQFNFPTAIFIDNQQRIVVGDTMNFRVQVLDGDGACVGMFGQAGDGAGYFSKIKGVALDSLGHIYVSDGEFDVVQVFDIKGNYLLTIGEQGRENGQFRFPAGVFVDRRDRVYIVDKLNQRVQIFRYMRENHGLES